MINDRPAPLRYALATVLPGLALALAELIPTRADPSHFSLFFIAVMLSSWYGGLGAGLLATILSALSLEYFFISKYFITLDWRAFLRLGVFTAIAALTSYLTNARKRAEQALREAHDELDQRVRERTAELAQANDTMRAEIVERKKAETELLRLQLELGRVERLATLGRMAGTIAHDLGTPLNSVLGYAQLLSQEKLTERARRRLSIIETQINRMGEIIQHYLSQTRGTAPKHAVLINDLVRDTLLLLQPIFDQRAIEVTSNCSDAPVIYGNSDSIQRMLINLLDNAMYACEKGGAIQISTKACSPASKPEGVLIKISDTGAGIAPELLPKIFDLFVTTKPPGRGTGLGLVICQEIVRAHGGTIAVESSVGRGTVVSIYLPVDARRPTALGTEENDECANLDRR
ncbi:MAG TPA: ATP-binding protein [Candidatus Udaeobacter sp.]|jgi:signal transduction histidine kinase|nr:ATP-binding protein [Candidatus Udaeobacter sp.]